MRKNVASQVIGAQMTTAADGTDFTGAVTVYVTGDAGTQAVGSVGSGACTHEGNGYHTYAPAQAETNYNLIAFTFKGTGAITVTVQVFTISFDPHDTVRLGLTALPNAAAAASGGLFIRGTGAGAINQNANGQVDVNVVNAAGTAWGSGAITAASIASNAIAAAKIATGAITNAKFAAGAIDAAAIASDAITAAKIAADAIGSSEFAQAAADKMWATAARTVTAATNITSTGGTTVPQTGDSFARIGATGSGLTSTAQASVCTETRLSELDAGTAGKAANQIDIIQTDTTTDIPGLIDALPTAVENRSEMDSNSTQLAAIKGKTDSLTFTETGVVDANVENVNDVPIGGAGTSGDPWGPAA